MENSPDRGSENRLLQGGQCPMHRLEPSPDHKLAVAVGVVDERPRIPLFGKVFEARVRDDGIFDAADGLGPALVGLSDSPAAANSSHRRAGSAAHFEHDAVLRRNVGIVPLRE